jgi:hypothetical protein
MINRITGVVAGLLLTELLAGAVPVAAQTPKVFYACYVPGTATVYRVRETGLKQSCTASSHVEFSWTDGADAIRTGGSAGGDLAGLFPNPTVARLLGRALSTTPPQVGEVLAWNGTAWIPTAASSGGATDHGLLAGLTDDDHPQYLRADGTRALAGNLGLGGNRLTGLAAGTANGDAVRFEQAVKSGDTAGGDLSGSFPNPAVAALRGRSVAATAPTDGQVLTWSASATSWLPSSPATGVTAHDALSGLNGDDHPHYLLGDGSRALSGNLNAGGFRLTSLAAASANGDAVRFEQAVKAGDTAGGDLSGSFPNPAVSALQGHAVSTTAPQDGQVLTWQADLTTWVPKTLAGGAGGVSDHGDLSGLSDDDHPQYLKAGVRESDNGFEVTGTLYTGAAPIEGAGTRLLWFPKAAAFRAGTINGTQWDEANIGIGSVAIGQNVRASGDNSTAFGLRSTAAGSSTFAAGEDNTASGAASVALGYHAHTNAKQGSFVFADRSSVDTLRAGVNHSANWRTSGGFRIFTTSNLSEGVTIQSGLSVSNWGQSNAVISTSTGAYLSTGGTWTNSSDVNRKHRFAPVAGEDVLMRLRSVPIQSWTYLADPGEVRHIGPMAQDFHAAFEVGAEPTSIATVDADGIALAGVKALDERTERLRSENERLRREVDDLRDEASALRRAQMETDRRVAELIATVSRLTGAPAPQAAPD